MVDESPLKRINVDDVELYNLNENSDEVLTAKQRRIAKYCQKYGCDPQQTILDVNKPGCNVELAIARRNERLCPNLLRTQHNAYYIAGRIGYSQQPKGIYPTPFPEVNFGPSLCSNPKYNKIICCQNSEKEEQQQQKRQFSYQTGYQSNSVCGKQGCRIQNTEISGVKQEMHCGNQRRILPQLNICNECKGLKSPNFISTCPNICNKCKGLKNNLNPHIENNKSPKICSDCQKLKIKYAPAYLRNSQHSSPKDDSKIFNNNNNKDNATQHAHEKICKKCNGLKGNKLELEEREEIKRLNMRDLKKEICNDCNGFKVKEKLTGNENVINKSKSNEKSPQDSSLNKKCNCNSATYIVITKMCSSCDRIIHEEVINNEAILNCINNKKTERVYDCSDPDHAFCELSSSYEQIPEIQHNEPRNRRMCPIGDFCSMRKCEDWVENNCDRNSRNTMNKRRRKRREVEAPPERMYYDEPVNYTRHMFFGRGKCRNTCPNRNCY